MTRTFPFKVIFLSLLIASISACSADSSTVANVNISSTQEANSAATTSGTPASGSAESADALAETLVADLYKQHDAGKGPFFQTDNRARVDKYFTKTLADLIWKDAVDSNGEVGALDADPLYDAQDTGIKNFSIGDADVSDDTAKVAVNFLNFGKKININYSFKKENGKWRIDNILYGSRGSILKRLQLAAKMTQDNTSPDGEFEGKFQVGDTTCRVKPVKMAFEVRWAKGSGVEVFFFKSGYTFESEPDKGEPNRFEFDDESYNTGIFYRGDGKEFPVKRLKS